MNPALLARLFQAQQMNTQPQPQGPPLALQQDPGALQWGGPQGSAPMGPGAPSAPVNINLNIGQHDDPGARAERSTDDDTLPPSDYKYLDRVEGDQHPLGVMFGQNAGEPVGPPQNVPMGSLPPGAQEGQYISPLDMRRMSTTR